MEVAIPLAEDFNFATTLSYTSAPSSPRPFGQPLDYCNYYASAPSSPSRRSASDVYKELLFNQDDNRHDYVVEKNVSEPFEFSFGFSGPLDSNCGITSTTLASADELFEDGRIRALKPQIQHGYISNDGSSTGYRGREALSGSSNRSRRMARSLSPMRSEDNPGFDALTESYSYSVDTDNSMNSLSGDDYATTTKKWSLKDLFLFRSASEGRATERGSKDPLLKYTLLSSSSSSSFFLRTFLNKKKTTEEESDKEDQQKSTANGSKFREKDSVSSLSLKRGSGRRVSVHEMHYASGRAAVMEEMKKRTPLAYHHNSMFSCLRFNSAASHHSISRVPSRSSFSRN